jgi:hypothetical protein
MWEVLRVIFGIGMAYVGILAVLAWRAAYVKNRNEAEWRHHDGHGD